MGDHRITAEEAADLRRWVVCEDRCEDPSMHEHFTSGRAFAWRRPTFNAYRVAEPVRFVTIGFNRYPHDIIGLAAVVRGRCFVVNWKGSPKRKPAASNDSPSPSSETPQGDAK